MRLALVPTMLLAAMPAMAQQEIPAEERAASQASHLALREGRYLAAAAALRPLAFDATDKPRDNSAHSRWVEVQALMIGDPSPSDMTPMPVPADEAGALRSATMHDALAEIVARAQATRVVILNEDHGLPRHRAFALEVARALRPLGYTVLAAETFSNSDAAPNAAMTALARDRYPARTTGYYTRDPVFGNFVRQSLALGYRPLAYEITEAQRGQAGHADIAVREEAQAGTLPAALKTDPAAKIFVYVGYSHAAEAPLDGGDATPNRWMANRLKAMTGVDPLTIDQTELSERPSYGTGARYALLADRIGAHSAVLFADARPLVVGQYAGAVDLQVVHPPIRTVSGRPAWLAGMTRTPTPVPAQYLPGSGTRLVQAFVASERDDAIPVDQVLVTAGEPVPALMLPGVPVRYAVQDPAAP